MPYRGPSNPQNGVQRVGRGFAAVAGSHASSVCASVCEAYTRHRAFARRTSTVWCLYRSMFSAADSLPKGSLTVSFKFCLFTRRLSEANAIGLKAANLLSFGTTAAGDSVYFDFDNKGFYLPAPGGYASGWHQVSVSFDSATGELLAYFDGKLGVNRTGVSQGKSLAGTFGPGFYTRNFCPRERSAFSTNPNTCRWHRVFCDHGVCGHTV